MADEAAEERAAATHEEDLDALNQPGALTSIVGLSIGDEQTHTLPSDPATIERFAQLQREGRLDTSDLEG